MQVKGALSPLRPYGLADERASRGIEREWLTIDNHHPLDSLGVLKPDLITRAVADFLYGSNETHHTCLARDFMQIGCSRPANNRSHALNPKASRTR